MMYLRLFVYIGWISICTISTIWAIARPRVLKYAVLHMNRDPWFGIVLLIATDDEWNALLRGLEFLERSQAKKRGSHHEQN